MSDVPCSFIKISKERLPYVDDAWVHQLSSSETEAMFHDAFAAVHTQAPPDRVTLARVQLLSPATASALACKADQIRNFMFRLIYPASHLPPGPSSFIALSYCWPTEPITTHEDPAKHALPDPSLFLRRAVRIRPFWVVTSKASKARILYAHSIKSIT
jgi:hypothetical protein